MDWGLKNSIRAILISCGPADKPRIMKPTLLSAAALAVILSSLSACNGKDAAIAAGDATTCKSRTASGLGYTEIAGGEGAMPGDNDEVKVKYRGTLAVGGKEFDASENADFPVGRLIAGFTEGLKLMHQGARYRFCIPAKLGYGDQASGSIPAGSDLIFDVTLLGVKPSLTPAAPHPATVAVADRVCSARTPSGLGYKIVDAGAGPKPVGTSVALVAYNGYLAKDGVSFDASNGTPLPVSEVVPGFSEGLKMMPKGARYKICIPSALGYGAKGAGPIPPNADLVFDLTMIDFKSDAEIQAMRAAGRR
jgi:FKBP-type peptidyl-prolyl cis-trans isomerase